MTFLPKNYPDSVTRDYLPYTLWHFAHSVSGTITGTLSTQALLQALGMGVGASIGIAATTNWIIKDGFGLLGGVLYAAFFGSRFDSQARRYRFLAAGSIQAATLAELLTPLVPQFFLPMASLSNVGKNIGWLAASATKASMHKGFAKEDNLGDITAKSGAQATLAGLVGTTGGIAISWLVAVASGGGTAVSPWVMFYAFAPLSAFNLWSAYRANLAVTTRSFNIERCELAIAETVGKICEGGDVGEAVKNILSPKEVGGKETFVMPFRSTYRIGLEVEPPIAKTLDRMDFETSMAFLNGASRTGGEMYRIFMAEEGKIYLWFVEGSAPEDHIKGFYHACVVRQMMEGERRL
ncbi:vitamin B6 photo-protection and homoeostasis-domain-containing protein [Chytridium lagenaria]|nr:vitamin B6 photo-protection and homoeostasis-domain-containing protein [Chytridium lagenaria]